MNLILHNHVINPCCNRSTVTLLKGNMLKQLNLAELQIRGGIEDNSKIIFSSPEPKAPGELIV